MRHTGARLLLAGSLLIAALTSWQSAQAGSDSTKAPSAAGEVGGYMLIEPRSLGVADDLVRSYTGMLRGELEEVLGAALRRPNDNQAADLAACADHECRALVARRTGANRIISATFAALGEAHSLVLRLAEAPSGAPLSEVQTTLSGTPDEVLAALHSLVLRLLAPDRLTASLLLETDIEGAQLFLNGALVGTTPLTGPITGLPPGKHALKLSGPHIEDFFTLVVLHPDKTTPVNITARRVHGVAGSARLYPSPPLHERWWFWASVAGVVATSTALIVYSASRGRDTTPTPGSLGLLDWRAQ